MPARDGIHLLNSANTIDILNTNVSGSAGDGLAILGGSANVTYSGQLAGNVGHDLNISNISGGTIDMTKATFGGSGSQGILLQNDAGTINFNNLAVASTAGKGIDIEGESGTVQFAGTTTVSGAAGTSVNIESLLSTGTVTFDNLAINNRQGSGLAIDNSSGSCHRQWDDQHCQPKCGHRVRPVDHKFVRECHVQRSRDCRQHDGQSRRESREQ